ncbi:MAG: DUF4013 domain-containing protein [Anaerolineae bacterium]|nr:DUF4013 domain-containing protein [Anaerolineae bacterium]
MDIGKAFSFITEDEKWVEKLGIGALIGMIPIANFAAFGYQVQIARNVWHGEERPLPTWDEFGKMFVDGLRIVGAMMVYMLPMILIYSVMVMGMVAFAFMTESGAYSSANAGGDEFVGIMIMMMSLSMLCIMPYMLLIWLLYPMFFIQVARHGSVKSCFAFRDMWALLRAYPANYLLVIGVIFGLYMILSIVIMPVYLVAMFIPCIGFIVTMLVTGGMTILVGAVSGHLEGQFILEGDTPIDLSGKEKEPI